MKTVNNELQTIATITQKNLTTTILNLYELGYDFNKSVGKQSQEVDEKVSQMMLSNLITNVPATPNVQEEITQQPVEEVIQVEAITEQPQQETTQEEEDIYRLERAIRDEKIMNKKYKKGETQRKRTYIIELVADPVRFGYNLFIDKKNSERYEKNSEYNRKKYKQEVTELVSKLFECKVNEKEEHLDNLMKKHREILRDNFSRFKTQ